MMRIRRNEIVHFVSALLAVLLLLPAIPARAAEVQVNPTIRVGLYFGSNALPGANLLNQVGSGYRFGYFDGNLDFVHEEEKTEGKKKKKHWKK